MTGMGCENGENVLFPTEEWLLRQRHHLVHERRHTTSRRSHQHVLSLALVVLGPEDRTSYIPQHEMRKTLNIGESRPEGEGMGGECPDMLDDLTFAVGSLGNRLYEGMLIRNWWVSNCDSAGTVENERAEPITPNLGPDWLNGGIACRGVTAVNVKNENIRLHILQRLQGSVEIPLTPKVNILKGFLNVRLDRGSKVYIVVNHQDGEHLCLAYNYLVLRGRSNLKEAPPSSPGWTRAIVPS